MAKVLKVSIDMLILKLLGLGVLVSRIVMKEMLMLKILVL